MREGSGRKQKWKVQGRSSFWIAAADVGKDGTTAFNFFFLGPFVFLSSLGLLLRIRTLLSHMKGFGSGDTRKQEDLRTLGFDHANPGTMPTTCARRSAARTVGIGPEFN